MEINFKKAFFAPFNDENWYQKIGIGVLLFIPSILAFIQFGEKNWIGASLASIASFMMAGYSWLVLHNEINNVEDTLPDWDFIKVAYLAIQGFIISFGYLLISLPVVAVFLALIMFLKPLTIIFAIVGTVFAFFWYLAFMPIAQGMFAKNFEFIEAFNFEKIYNIAKNSWQYYLLALFYSILIGLIFGVLTGFAGFIGGLLGVIGKFISSIIMQLGQVLTVVASANLYGQTFKKATQIDVNQ